MIVNPYYGYCIVETTEKMNDEIVHNDAFVLPDAASSVE